MAAKLTRLTHKIATQLHIVAESCTICSSRSRRPVRKLLDTPSIFVLPSLGHSSSVTGITYQNVPNFSQTWLKNLLLDCHFITSFGVLNRNKFPVWWPGNKNSPTVTHACRKRRLKWVATLPLGDMNAEAWSSGMGVGRGANTTL
jgi:hypothetical protein